MTVHKRDNLFVCNLPETFSHFQVFVYYQNKAAHMQHYQNNEDCEHQVYFQTRVQKGVRRAIDL